MSLKIVKSVRWRFGTYHKGISKPFILSPTGLLLPLSRERVQASTYFMTLSFKWPKTKQNKKSKILAINIIKCVLKKTQTTFSSIRGKPKLNGALRIKICNSWNCCASVNMTELFPGIGSGLWPSKNFDWSKLQKLYSWRQVSSFLFLVKM